MLKHGFFFFFLGRVKHGIDTVCLQLFLLQLDWAVKAHYLKGIGLRVLALGPFCCFQFSSTFRDF